MKLEDIRVESFPTTDEVNLMPTETWNDATAGCCAPPPPFSYKFTCTCVERCL